MSDQTGLQNLWASEIYTARNGWEIYNKATIKKSRIEARTTPVHHLAHDMKPLHAFSTKVFQPTLFSLSQELNWGIKKQWDYPDWVSIKDAFPLKAWAILCLCGHRMVYSIVTLHRVSSVHLGARQWQHPYITGDRSLQTRNQVSEITTAYCLISIHLHN